MTATIPARAPENNPNAGELASNPPKKRRANSHKTTATAAARPAADHATFPRGSYL